MFPPTHSWSQTKGSLAVLFFAQSMREMLTTSSFESFRAFTLETVSRIKELISVYRDVNRQDIPAISAETFAEELRWSLDRDPVIAKIAPELSNIVTDQIKSKSASVNERISALILLCKRVESGYLGALQAEIVDRATRDEKIALRAAAGYYCSHLINMGHSPEFLLRVVETSFFSGPVARAGVSTLNAFFKRVARANAKYIVYTVLHKNYATAVSRLGFEMLDASSLPTHVAHAFALATPIGPDERVVSYLAEARDEEAAASQSELILGALAAINQLGSQHHSWSAKGERYVCRQRATQGIIVPRSRLLLSRLGPRRQRGTAADFRQSARRIINNFDPKSTTRLLNSFTSSAVHRSLTSVESQLIAIWSAVEVLLGSPPENTARIVHYANTLGPCISLKYMRRVINAVYDGMHASYRGKFLTIVNKERTFRKKDFYTRFAAVMLLPKNSYLREQLLVLAAGNPLAQHRLYRINRDFSDPKNARRAISSHADRLRWQIFRIYRARNQLVHGGGRPIYLEGITQNLYEYYRDGIWMIVDHARKDSVRAELSQAAAEVRIEYEIYMKKMTDIAKNNVFDQESLLIALGVK